jgi:NMD protein affecting ribosome stability and mRNA decay
MNVSFKSIRQERRIQNEEEEELLQIVDKLALLKEMQANINLHVEEEGLDLNQIE